MKRRVLACAGLLITIAIDPTLVRAQSASAPDTPDTPQSSAAAQAPDQSALADEFRAALADDKSQPPTAAESPAPASSSSSVRLALIDLAFDLLAAGGSSSADEPELRQLEGGGHDPKNRGFTIQNTELTFAGVVDPYFRGDANIVMQIDPLGESTIELEEAYLTTLDLPFNLQAKAGQFLTAFGRLNPTHPHTWDFVDQPVVNTRLLGPDGLRNPGAQLSWLTPLPFFAELSLSAQNSQGDTAPSFRGVPGSTFAGRALTPRNVRDLGDLIYLLRLRTSFDLSDDLTVVAGLSALFGPNATSDDTRSEIYGADLYVKWKPLSNDHGWPFLAWQTEALWRRYQAAAVVVDTTLVAARDTLDDWGMYSQLVYGFARPWTLGVRYDYARGQNVSWQAGDASYSTQHDALRDERQRISGSLTYYPSEFSKIRAQYNYDRSDFLARQYAHSVWVQCEILFGAHGAHKF